MLAGIVLVLRPDMQWKRLPHIEVNVHGGYDERKARTIHRKVHTGCPRMPQHYGGTPSPHPLALT